LALAIAALPANRAAAQDQPASQQPSQLEEITVTGSRILRRDNSSNSPIVTVESDAFQAQNGLNFEAYLNQLPEYNPAASPTTTQADVQITPVNSVGIASISLRGFGPNRSLVLVNGKRQVPINALMVTDINAIPSALVQRVETITGGASAVYGADAVGGVTNFILRDNFQGLQIDTQYGANDTGDGAESRVSAVFGTNSADGKGNIALGAEYYNRDAALAVNNSFYTDRYSDPYAPGYFAFLQGTTNLDCQLNCPNNAAYTAVFKGTNPFNTLFPNSSTFRPLTFNADGTIFTQGGFTNNPVGMAKYNPNNPWTFFPYKVIKGDAFYNPANPSATTIQDGLKWENSQQLVSAPQNRYSLFATGHYDITDNLTFFARGSYAESETRTSLFGTNAIAGWEATVPYNPTLDSPINPAAVNWTDPAQIAAAIAAVKANPHDPTYGNPSFIPTGTPGAHYPVPVEAAALLNARTTPNAVWLPGWSPDLSLPPRSTINTNTVWQVETGLNLKIGENWTGELYYSHGQSSTYNNANGNMSLTRYRTLLNSATLVNGVLTSDWGRGAKIAGNATSVRPTFGAAQVTCTSGFYNTFFAGDARLSDDCFDAVNATLQTRAQNKQDIIELNFQGVLAKMKPGELRAAFGYQGRNNSATFVPDILQSTVSFTDQVIGVYPTGYLDASTTADDLYLETLVPMIANRKGAHRLELELGARSSKYGQGASDQETTWKSLLNWEINDWFRFRGGFNRATRAPNIGELYLNQQEIFTVGGNNYGDPCGLRSTAPFGAGGTGPDPIMSPLEPPTSLAPGATAQSAQSARLICEAMMGAFAANQFYKINNAAPGGGALFNWVNQVGNSNLTSETADTWTWGFVMAPPFKSPLLSGINITVDTYKIDIANAIMLNSVDNANFNCYGKVLVTDAAGAAAQAASPACQLVTRDQQSGVALATTVSYTNQATIKTQGTDLALNWRANFADFGSKLKGGLGYNLQVTYLDYYKTKQSPAVFDVETDWKGSLGPNLVGTNPGAYDYRLFSTLSYFRDTWSVSLRWRGLPSVWSAAYQSQQAVKANNASVAAGGPGITLGYVPSTEIKTDAYKVFDLSFSYNIKERMSLRGGITNVLNTEPVNVASTAGVPIGSDFASYCGGAVGSAGYHPGCQAPTAPSLPTTGGFNGGYYDVLGRRAFLGFNVSF
jgi:outer membrane receptor protein involved in Fe transport